MGKGSDLKVALIVLAVVAGLGGFGVFAYRGITGVVDAAEAVDRELTAPYLALLQGGEYGEAYDRSLGPALKSEIDRVSYVATLQARATQYGALTGWKQTTVNQEANLFGDKTLLDVKYVLHYERRNVFVLYQVDIEARPYRIVASFGSEGGGGTLSQGAW